jgi:homoserine kinase type II
VPIPAHSGETIVRLEEPGAVAALVPLIPGRHPRETDPPDHVWACGAALAELDAALARVEVPAPTSLRRFGALLDWHPAVPDPLRMVAELPLDGGKRQRLAGILEALSGAAPALQGSLPVQPVHRDYDGTNVLVEGRRVSGILDFEFAAPDIRAIDLAVAVVQFAAIPWDERGSRIVSSLAGGYRERLELGAEEIAAVPLLMRLYRAVSLIHRAGRFRLGLAAEGAVLSRAEALLRVDAWLRERPGELERALG